jgi:hypothetical protein
MNNHISEDHNLINNAPNCYPENLKRVLCPTENTGRQTGGIGTYNSHNLVRYVVSGNTQIAAAFNIFIAK